MKNLVKVSFDETSEGYIFECDGHAGYAPAGQDIVCAGVSALCLALLKELEELTDEDEVIMRSRNIAPGNVYIEVDSYNDSWSRIRLQEVMSTVRKGMEAIENLYPDYLEIA